MQIWLVALPALVYTALVLVLRRKPGVGGLVDAFVKAHLVVFCFVTLITEALSAVRGISVGNVLVSWCAFLLITSLLLLKRTGLRSNSQAAPRRYVWANRLLIPAIFMLLATTLLTAIVFPPNNWDSMTYHMARVVHWFQQGTVNFYPTPEGRQLALQPLAEYAILHLQILTGGDWVANLVQWISFVIAVSAAALIAAELDLDTNQQILSAMTVATMPMAILQASSTQTDLAVTGFLMSFALFMLKLRRQWNAENLLFASLSLGLAFLTKGTAYLSGAAIGCCLAIPVLLGCKDNHSRLRRATMLALAACLALSLNAGHYWRTYAGFGKLLASGVSAKYDPRNQEMSFVHLGANLLRNFTLHTGLPITSLNDYQYRFVKKLLGSNLNHPGTTLGEFGIAYSRHEDTAGNLLHALLLLAGCVCLLHLWRQNRYRNTVWYATSVAVSIVLFSWFLRWQPWGSRYHTQIFALSAPLMAMTITTMTRWKGAGFLVASGLFLYSLQFALANKSRSLLSLDWVHSPREQLYFSNRNEAFEPYATAVKHIGQVEGGEVGLHLRGDDWEYPIWVLSGCSGADCKFQFVNVVEFTSARSIHVPDGLPDFVISTAPFHEWEYAPYYLPAFRSDVISVFEKIAVGDFWIRLDAGKSHVQCDLPLAGMKSPSRTSLEGESTVVDGQAINCR